MPTPKALRRPNRQPDWQQVQDSLHDATDRELARLRVAIDRILLDPERIARIRARLAVGQFVQYLSERQQRINGGRIVELMTDRVLIRTHDHKLRWLHYAAIQLDPPVARTAGAHPVQGAGFAVGARVSYEGRDLVHHFGIIKRINRKTATVTTNAGDLRVAYALLRRVVDL